MQIKQSEIIRLVGNAKPMTAEELQETAAIRVNVAGLKDGDVVEFPDNIAVYAYVVNGNTTPIVLAKVNKTPARFFLSTFMNQGYPVIARGTEEEITKRPDLAEDEVPEYLKNDDGRNLILANEGEVMDAWKKQPDLQSAVSMLAGKKIEFHLLDWIQTQFQKRRRFEIKWA